MQLALARQDVKERESSDDGVAGWMTATARADIGARFEARSISVGPGLHTDDRKGTRKPLFVQVRILAHLDEAEQSQSQERIREGVEGRTQIIRAALKSLTRAGKVRQSGNGKRGNMPFVSLGVI